MWSVIFEEPGVTDGASRTRSVEAAVPIAKPTADRSREIILKCMATTSAALPY